MKNKLSSPILVMLCWLSVIDAAERQASKSEETLNPNAQLLQDFQARIGQYMDLHERLEEESPSLKKTADPAKIAASQGALAERIRGARVQARRGDIFTPEIGELFRRLMHPELNGADAAGTKETIKQDAPAAGSVTFKVNVSYPEKQPLPTMPPNILAVLPQLPVDLEYRIVGTHLILHDIHANIIVDFIPNAIP